MRADGAESRRDGEESERGGAESERDRWRSERGMGRIQKGAGSSKCHGVIYVALFYGSLIIFSAAHIFVD